MKVLGSVELLKKTYDRLLTDVAKKYDLTLTELKIINYLSKNELNVAKDVVEGIKATKSHVSMSVADLEEKGFIERKNPENDKKKLLLKLTPKADNVVKEGTKVQKQIKDIMLNGINKEEIEMLTKIAKKIGDNLVQFTKEETIC